MRLFYFIKGAIDHKTKQFYGLLDNQNYVFSERGVRNNRLPSKEIIFDGKPGRRTRPEHYEDRIWDFLNYISHDIDEILKNNDSSSLVLFNDKEYENNVDGGFFNVTGSNARNFSLNTGNLIGFVKRDDYTLKISSRFGDSFLRYIIADADGFLELENIGGENHTDGYEWLLAYLWNIKLKRAYRLGLPKIYVTETGRISRVKGAIDPVDFFQNKTSGKYLCSYREHSYDSPATSLFIKAYEAVEHYSFCHHSRNIYSSFVAANQGVKRTNHEILKTQYFTNPFYNDYNILIDLSRQVIMQQGANFESKNKTSAFLFDVSMLFEYFIRKMLRRSGLHLVSKHERRHEIPTGSIRNYIRKLEPDIVFENNDGLYVFDVKYKTIDPVFGVKREDLFQLHTYIGQYANMASIRGCGFIYPIAEQKWKTFGQDKSTGIISDVIYQNRSKIPFHILFLRVPHAELTNFNAAMKESCALFTRDIKSILLNP